MQAPRHAGFLRRRGLLLIAASALAGFIWFLSLQAAMPVSAEAEYSSQTIGSHWEGARYRRGSGTDTLVFGHEVKQGDLDGNGISVHDGYVDSDGRQHGIGGSNTAVDTYAEVNPVSSGFPNKADGSEAPFVTSVEMASSPADGDTYRQGESIEIDVTFSSEVEVSSEPAVLIALDISDITTATYPAEYKSGSGTRMLRFAHVVMPGVRDPNGLTIASRRKEGLGLGLGTIKAVGTDISAEQNYDSQWNLAEHKVDGRPYVKSIAITSTPTDGETYALDESVEVAAYFDQKVDVEGVVELPIEVGGETRLAAYLSGSGTKSLLFSYEVKAEDGDSDGISVLAGTETTGLGASEGTIKLADFWLETKFNPSYDGLPDAPAHRVDGSVTRDDQS